MPVIIDFLAFGMIALAAIVVTKTLVLSTPLKTIPGLGAFAAVA